MCPRLVRREDIATVKADRYLSNVSCTGKHEWQASHIKRLYTVTISQ